MDHEHLVSFSDNILVILEQEDIEFFVAAILRPFCRGMMLAELFCDTSTLF